MYLRNRNQGDGAKKGDMLLSGHTCYYCKRKGHIMLECWALEKKEKIQNTDLVVTESDVQNRQYILTGPKSEENEFKSFISEGRVSLIGCNTINILRDTGVS